MMRRWAMVDKPRPERSRRIVGVSDRVNGQEDVLDRIFDIRRISVASRGKAAQVGGDVCKEAAVGTGVAGLRMRHQDRPVELALTRSVITCIASRVTAP